MKLFAQPYDSSAKGFYFESLKDFNEKQAGNFNPYGEHVEEYEIQFIDGTETESLVFDAIGANQANLENYFNAVDSADNVCTAILKHIADESYYRDFINDNADCLGREINDRFSCYELDSSYASKETALGYYLVYELGFINIPEHIEPWFDFDSYGYDQSVNTGGSFVNVGFDWFYVMDNN